MTGEIASFDSIRTAVLSMDYQTAIVSIYAKDPDMLARAAGVLRRARSSGMQVIHVRVGFRPNLPEISARNSLFSAVKNSEKHRQIFEGPAGDIHPALAPEGNDIVVVKHRVSAFTGTDLDMILRANDIGTLILYGIATSGVVLATLLDAVDADYRTFVIGDCCEDREPEVHTCLVDKVFPHYSTLMTAADF
jgi:nicotinamidase-related amidase